MDAVPVKPHSHAVSRDICVRYHGDGARLFGLALRTGLLTLLTLGIYRFWAKTRIRRFVWSASEVDGARLEYTGTGLEKFLGFLVALVLLAVYLGLMQMALFYFGIALFREPESDAEMAAQAIGSSVTGLAVVPVVQFAIYRARRYKLARTRLRGIRFGMDNAAWGYALRAVVYGLLVITTLGILLPLATFRLEKYMTDRTWFGDARFTQTGRWQDLYRAMTHLLIGLTVMGLSLLIAYDTNAPLGAALVFAGGLLWAIFGMVHYQVQSFAYLTSHKVLGSDVRFTARPRTATVVRIYLVGTIALSLLVSLGFALLSMVVGAEALIEGAFVGPPSLGMVVLTALGYLTILVAAGAGALALISQPVLRHYVTSTVLHNIDALDAVAQRGPDSGADAEGFADALDVGGAF